MKELLETGAAGDLEYCESCDALIGKIKDLFAYRGLTETHATEDNTDGIHRLVDMLDVDFNGLCFVNLVDFDMWVEMHRKEIELL